MCPGKIMKNGVEMASIYKALLSVFLLIKLGSCAPVKKQLERIRVHPTEHFFLDEHNRVRIFHGINTVYKGFPWYPWYMNEGKYDNLQKWGFNIVRQGSMWAGVEPAEGQYNVTYTDILKQMTQQLADRGIYTMMDMHQDVLSTLYHAYDGIPLWLAEKFPEPTNPYPWPLDDIIFWEQGYLTQACSEGFQYLYDNYAGALDAWVDFWGYMAENFKDADGMLGYNLINEPWVGDYTQNPLLLLPGVAGRTNLARVYDDINERIRSIDEEGIIFYEPVFHGQAGEDEFLGNGFDTVPGGDAYQDVSAYSYHMYCWAMEFIGADATDEEKKEAVALCENFLLPQMMRAQASSTNRTGGAAILTEFGLCRTDQEYIDIDCRVYMDLCDQNFQSWIEWAQFMGDDDPDNPQNLHWIRTYAQAIAGTPTLMNFDADTNEFMLMYQLDTSIDAPTVIYIPSLRYTNGYNVELSSMLSYEEVEDWHLIHVTYTGSAQNDTVFAGVRITAL